MSRKKQENGTRMENGNGNGNDQRKHKHLKDSTIKHEEIEVF